MPIFKIRFRDNYDLPMRGEDIVAFKFDTQNRVTRLIIGEAKTTVRYQRSIVRKAHNRLGSAYHPRPMTLAMLAEILYEAGKDALAREIDPVSDELISRGFPRENWIFVINQSQPEDVFGHLEADGQIVQNLHCVNLALQNLSAFVHDLFDDPSIMSQVRT